MKTEKWMSLAFAAVLLLGASCSDDWGQTDPPAGNQTYPKLENVAAYDFEEPELDPVLFKLEANTGGVAPAVVEDEEFGNVLELNNGYVKIVNPLSAVECQKAASLTFWVKQIPETIVDEEGNEVSAPQDVTSPLFTFTSAGENASMKISSNAWLLYDGPDGTWSENDPSVATTGYIPANAWTYVALVVRNDGYDVYVDGDLKTSKKVDNFDCSKVVGLMNKAASFTIGSPETASRFMIDDLKLYRNALTNKEIARPNKGGGGGQGPVVDLSKWILVGQEDNSTPFWTDWAPYVNLTGNGTIHYQFYNYTCGDQNWQNWLLAITNGIERGGDGYVEYLIMRSDAYGWGTLYNGDNNVHDFNFDTFKEDMNGALVDMDITRTGASVKVVCKITTESGTVYNYSTSIEGVDSETIGTFLLCEGAHLLINPDEVFIGDVYAPGTNVLGNQDYSTGWWSAWSDLNVLNGTVKNFCVEFTNHNNGSGGNWNNWLLVCTNGKWIGGDGYAEYFVLRSDAYGWGDKYESGTMTQAFEWDTYVADMSNSYHRVYFNYVGGKLTMISRANKTDGTPFPEYRFEVPGLDAPVGVFFTVELAWLDITRVGYFPWVDLEPQQ